MNSKPYRLPAIILTTALLLSACGGGSSSGGSSSPTPEPPPEPLEPPSQQTFTVSGTVTATPNQAVDGDTNDPRADYLPNDTVASAQAIANPVTLGGYVNQPGSGSEGRSQVSGDEYDYFRVSLLAGQTVTMLVADYLQADVDLYLHDLQGNILDFSIEYGEVESLVVPADGDYLVSAVAFEGASNYILAIGTQAGANAHSRQHYAIEPWQAVVSYRSDHLPGSSREVKKRLHMEETGGAPGRPRLLAMQRGLANRQDLEQRLGPALPLRERIEDPALAARFETLVTIKRLRRDPAVLFAEPNYRLHSYLEPDDEAFPFQWHYPLIDLPAAWDSGAGDESVIVAVIDTGILSAHPDLEGQLVGGYDFVRDPIRANDGNGIDPDPSDPGNSTPGSSSYHGTHVAGTVAAAGNNGLGVAGVAYGSRLMPLRVLGEGGAGTSYDVSQAVRYAAGLANDSGTVPPRPARVINLSLGGGPFSQPDQQLFAQVRARGITVVAAAGNEASTVPQYPASYDGVISVGAVGINRRVAPYSNRGRQLDLTAPGGNNGTDLNGDGYPDGVLSTGGNGSDFAYTFLSGTSMASPHVAGVIALMLSANPELTPENIDTLLQGGRLTDDLGLPGRDDNYGHGLINAYKSVLAALEARGSNPADTPRLIASASILSFGSSGTPLALELANAGRGELTVQQLVVSHPWLKLEGIDVDAAGLGSYQVGVDRDGLEAGVYSGEITVLSSANALSVQVLMSVGGAGSAADVGAVYILLLERDAEEATAQGFATSEDGNYRFTLRDVPAGEYQLVAGSDADNDLFICDPGEACGAWLTLDQPILLQLEGDRSELNFPVEYQVFIPDVSSAGQLEGPSLPTTGERKRKRLPNPSPQRMIR